jgi:hypothetical protein
VSGYVVAARVEAGGPRFVGWSSIDVTPDRDGPSDALPTDLIALDEPSLDQRWDAIRDRLSQLTFFLFDGDSWRA